MRILAIDTSMSCPGAAILEVKNGKVSIRALSHIKTNTSMSHGMRADLIESWLTLFIAEHIGKKGFQGVTREDFSGRTSKQSHPVFAAWSSCDRALHKFGLNFTAPATAQSSVKKLVVGKGVAEKPEVEAAVRKWTGYEGEFKTDDESDAAAVGLAYLILKGEIK